MTFFCCQGHTAMCMQRVRNHAIDTVNMWQNPPQNVRGYTDMFYSVRLSTDACCWPWDVVARPERNSAKCISLTASTNKTTSQSGAAPCWFPSLNISSGVNSVPPPGESLLSLRPTTSRLRLGAHYWKIWRRPQNRKFIATSPTDNRDTATDKNALKIWSFLMCGTLT